MGIRITNAKELKEGYLDAFGSERVYDIKDVADNIEDSIESFTLVKDLKVGETYQVIDNLEDGSEDIATFFYKLISMHIDKHGCVVLDAVEYLEYQK